MKVGLKSKGLFSVMHVKTVDKKTSLISARTSSKK